MCREGITLELWLAVTPDELELPLFVADTAIELATKYKVSEKNVKNSIKYNHSGRQTGRKFVKITIEEEEV